LTARALLGVKIAVVPMVGYVTAPAYRRGSRATQSKSRRGEGGRADTHAHARPSTHYIATITKAVRDLARNSLAANYVWSFDTGTNGSIVRPTVTSTNPASNASLVPINEVNATFRQPMKYATITIGDFLLTWSRGRVVGTVSYLYDSINNVTISTFVPQANLLTNTLYTARLPPRPRI
jgi:hypothetical protein